MNQRFEEETQVRKDRARAHLARARSRHAASRVVWKRPAPQEPAAAKPIRRSEILLVLCASALAGSLLGDGWLVSARDALEAHPAPLTRIAVSGARQLSARSVAEATGVQPGTALSELDLERVAENLRAQPWIRSARATRMPSGSLVVAVTERIPAATTLAGDPARPFAVDTTGAVFAPLAELEGERLPRLVLAEPPALGEEDATRARAIELGTHLPDFGLAAPQEIGVMGGARGFTLRFAGLDTEFVLGQEDLTERLDRLSRLLAQRPAEVAAAARVDLRFEDQVVLQKGEAREGSLHNATSRGDAASRGTRHAG